MSLQPPDPRLQQHLGFIFEINALKDVLRRSLMPGSERRENSAEHSWHVALMAEVLREHANDPVDVSRVVRMLLIHDIVEVDAGDTYVYDTDARADQAERELRAAERLFGLLPADQNAAFRSLWDEFEAGQSPDAKFAKALDRFQPLFLNYAGGGVAWKRNGITRDQVVEINAIIADGSSSLWQEARRIIDRSCENGWLS